MGRSTGSTTWHRPRFRNFRRASRERPTPPADTALAAERSDAPALDRWGARTGGSQALAASRLAGGIASVVAGGDVPRVAAPKARGGVIRRCRLVPGGLY